MDIPKLKKQAGSGNIAAQALLGSLYFEGHGVEVDYGLAFRWLSEPAARGVPRAAYFLARMFAAGLGVQQDHAEARRLFEVAARQDFFARIELARIYARGIGMQVDREQARKWYKAALAQEDDVAECDAELSEARAYVEPSA